MLNSVIMMGRLTADPELRHTPNNVPVTSFTIAVDRTYAKPGTERQTDFFDVVAWNKSAEFVSRYFHKGQLVAVQGRMETRTYDDKNGVRRKAYEIVAENVHFAEPKRDSAGGAPVRGDETSQIAPSFANTGADDFTEITDSNDDLPF